MKIGPCPQTVKAPSLGKREIPDEDWTMPPERQGIFKLVVKLRQLALPEIVQRPIASCSVQFSSERSAGEPW